jgi:hypothetical protein
LGVEHGATQDVLEALYQAFPEAAGLKPKEDVSLLEPGRSTDGSPLTALPEDLAAKFQDGKRRGEVLEEQLKAYLPHGFLLSTPADTRQHFSAQGVISERSQPR